jgi:hypothetical protein
MLKKIIISTLVIILLGAVVVGAIDAYRGNSTLQLPEVSAQANPLGWGQGQGQGQGMGQGRGQGRGMGQGQGMRNQSQAQMIEHEWTTLQGTVDSVDPQSMVVDTAEQGQLTLALGPVGFAEQQDVTFNPGDTVTVLGFDEGGMFHAGEITNDTTGEILQLRDPNGRPLWAGQGQGGQMVAQAPGGQGRGRGQGDGGQGQGQMGQADNTGIPQAMVDKEWITVNGTITAIDRGITVDTTEMGQIIIQTGPPWFADQQEITFNAGDTVTILGFAGEGNVFQAGEITDDTTGATLHLRDPNGRPLWAGRGGSGGGQ